MTSENRNRVHPTRTQEDAPTPKGGAFTQDVFYTFSTQIIIFIGAAVTSIMIARMLGPSGKGVVAIAMIVPQLIAIIGGLGINIANTYYAGRPGYSDKLFRTRFWCLCFREVC